jgi:predicted RNase H-like HicB family nuclease
MEMTANKFRRFIARIIGHSGLTGNSATLFGERRDGGYYFLTSQDLPGFTFLLTPEEAEDIEKLSEAIKPALSAYLNAYIRHKKNLTEKQISPRISYADLRGSHAGKPMNLIAELCAT